MYSDCSHVAIQWILTYTVTDCGETRPWSDGLIFIKYSLTVLAIVDHLLPSQELQTLEKIMFLSFTECPKSWEHCADNPSSWIIESRVREGPISISF